MQMNPSPWMNLPLDLVPIIVRISALESYSQAARLSLVCKRFRSWVHPILYYTCICEPGRCRPKHLTIPWLKRNGKCIHRLLWVFKDSVLPVLKRCPNIEHLTLWGNLDNVDPSKLLPVLSALPLWYLSTDLTALTGGDSFSTLDAKAPLFQSITHLHPVLHPDQGYTWQQIEGLSAMRSLTHLCLSGRFEEELVHDILKFCLKIRVLIVCYPIRMLGGNDHAILNEPRNTGSPERGGVAKPPHPESALFNDIRVVIYYCNWSDEYEVSSRGGEDMWAAAEKLIAERQRVERT